MKTIKTIVLILALGMAGYAYAAGDTDATAHSCKMSGATASCCVAEAKCCKPEADCCKPGAECCKKDSACCGKDSKCCTADAKCSAGDEGCCKADSKTESGCCGTACSKHKHT